MFAFKARILVCSGVPPGPPVESPFLHVGDVVRHEVIAESVTLVDRGPQLARFGMDGYANRIANPRGIDSLARSIRIELNDVGTIFFLSVITDVFVRANRDVHLLTIG